MLNLIERPESLCILRLSAIGDTCHVVPVVRTLQRVWPTTQLTWVIGRVEARLMSLLPGVEFITIDKRAGFSTARTLRTALRGRRFDVLLHMQLSLRASLASLTVRSRLRLGFDRARAREQVRIVVDDEDDSVGRKALRAHRLDGLNERLPAIEAVRANDDGD